MRTQEEIEKMTRDLRAGNNPFWFRLNALLREKGLDPASVIVADCFPDDCQLQFGLIVTNNRKAYQFGFDYLHKTISEGIFSKWKELTESYTTTCYCDRIEHAMSLLDRLT